MRVKAVAADGAGIVWLLDGLPLVVHWHGPGTPLYLENFPWPGEDEGVREPIGVTGYLTGQAADQAARSYIAGLPG